MFDADRVLRTCKEGKLIKKQHTSVRWGFYFDSMPKRAIWVYRNFITPKQDELFSSMEAGSMLTITYSKEIRKSHNYYLLRSYEIITLVEKKRPIWTEELTSQFQRLFIGGVVEKNQDDEEEKKLLL